jgi:hypothetical protein
MDFYYITIKTCLHNYIHQFIFYVLWNNHSPPIDFTHSQIMPKPSKIKLSILFTSILYKTFHSYNKF